MADSVEDDDKWLYNTGDSSATNNNDGQSEQTGDQQTDDLSQIFDTQSSVDYQQLYDLSNPSQGQNSSQNLDQLMDTIKEENDFESNDKQLNPDLNDNNEEEDDDEDEEDDDDDDDVQVTIGDIKANTSFPYGSAPMNLNITKRSATFASGQTSVANKQKPGLDIDAIGIINGVSIYDVNLDSLEEKPWRKPGADITDYFNYGFNEEMWKLYCERQKKLRSHDFLSNGPPQTVKPVPSFSGAPPGPGGVVPAGVGGKPGAEQLIPIASVNENSKYTGLGPTKKAGPPPGRKQSGTIDVIGGGTPTTPSMLPSRRPPDTKENFIQVIGNRPPGPPPPPGLPPGMPFPPPGMSMPPPFGFPPPGVEFPPGMPPPGMPLIAPNGQPLPFPPGEFPPMRFPHPGMVPHQDHHFDEPNEGFHEGMPNDGRDEDRERGGDRDRDRDYHRSGRGYSREYRDDESYRSGRSGHYRERDYEHREQRSRDRDDYEGRRHRDRETKERERDKGDRERERENRDSSSRRRHRDEHEEESRSSSRHKHSKRSKRDKEEEEKESKH